MHGIRNTYLYVCKSQRLLDFRRIYTSAGLIGLWRIIILLCMCLQWLSVPFAFYHPAVSSISGTSDKWVGSLDRADIGVWIDSGLLLIFGGIPWQVCHVSAPVVSIRVLFVEQL